MARILGILVFLSGLYAQGQVTARTFVQPLKNITTKIIVEQERDPIFYSDEPRSALQRVVVQRCDSLLAQLKMQPTNWVQIRTQVQELEESLDKLHRLRYALIIPQQKSSRVIVNYFSSSF